ncbi:epoxide hydrolase family protein [Kordiimonas sp.]|uniref:epoxide hydrolase family protein n=1 Tax=Kordiimonas sp. TaxID=1970157 RepID=UPI003A902416
MPRKFTVQIPQCKIEDIKSRVKSYSWFAAPQDEEKSWSRGVNTSYLKELCDYWVCQYDWRANEAHLNQFPQFIETIDGIDIHFLHVRGEGSKSRPIILTHGWPGSHYEFWSVIEQLAFPSRNGGNPEDAFDVIVPSLPGFGFSGKPPKPIGPRATARLWNKLMTECLGYSRYLAQGGDLGSLVTSFLGLDFDACVGIHLNMISLQPADSIPVTDEEADWLQVYATVHRTEGAYLHQHTTKPQTIAIALGDSPVGTAAWILEKVHGWTDLRAGSLKDIYSNDEILTNIMIYLVNDAISSSIWFYRGLIEEGNLSLSAEEHLSKPTGIANFLGEPVFNNPPRSWAERMFNIVHWTDIDQGGHFAAMENPKLFANDVQDFARLISF